jgi:hypothetical protein
MLTPLLPLAEKIITTEFATAGTFKLPCAGKEVFEKFFSQYHYTNYKYIANPQDAVQQASKEKGIIVAT